MQPLSFIPHNEKKPKVMNTSGTSHISPPVLLFLNSEGGSTFTTSAYNLQAGYDLLQKQHDQLSKQVKYWSQSLTKTRQFNGTTQRKFLIVVCSVLLFSLYIENVFLSGLSNYDTHD